MCFCRVPRRLEWTESVRTRNSYTESPARVGVLALVLVITFNLGPHASYHKVTFFNSESQGWMDMMPSQSGPKIQP
jgi:hypothetical protein